MEYVISKFMFKPPKSGFNVNTFEDGQTASMLEVCDENEERHVVFVGRVQAVVTPERYILYCHGNAEDILILKPFLNHISAEFNAVVYAVEYTGYGPTRYMTPTMTRTYKDVLVASEHLSRIETLPRVVWGRSMGCAPAMRAVATHGLSAAAIMESAFLSPLMTVVPVHLPIETMFENIEEVENVPPHVAMLFIHGVKDKVVPFWHGQRLFKLCRSRQKQFLDVPEGTHNNLHSAFNRPLVESALHDAIDSVS